MTNLKHLPGQRDAKSLWASNRHHLILIIVSILGLFTVCLGAIAVANTVNARASHPSIKEEQEVNNRLRRDTASKYLRNIRYLYDDRTKRCFAIHGDLNLGLADVPCEAIPKTLLLNPPE